MGSSSCPAVLQPVVRLTRYTKRWINDRSRFKIGAMTRQGGKSFGAALEVVLDCNERVTTWVLLSAGERQSRELMNKCAIHARAINLAVEILESDYRVEDTVYKLLDIRLPNGSRIVGLPANPDTARGWSANILLDEFAMHARSREIWAALFPSITRGFRIIIVSTFKGKSNKFYELFYSAPTLQRFIGEAEEHVGERGGWSKHLVSIEDAVSMGLELRDDEGKPCEPEDLRLALQDDDAWMEEFMCQASDEASAFLPHDLISAVESPLLTDSPSWVTALVAEAQEAHAHFKRTGEDLPPSATVLEKLHFLGKLYVGVDVGRKKDLTVIWLDQEIDNLLQTLAAIQLKAQPFYVQKWVLRAIYGLPSFTRSCHDSTGLGAQLAEDLQDLFGAHRVEAVDFTSASKEALAVGLKQNFEDGGSRIPCSAVIRASLHSVKKYSTTTKHFRFDADRTEATGHADHFWAKALAVQAGTKAAGPAVYGSADPETARRGLGLRRPDEDDENTGVRRLFGSVGRLFRRASNE